MPQVPLGTKGITTAQWEAAAMQVLPQPEVKRKREAFSRVTPSIIAKGYAHCFADSCGWRDSPVAMVAPYKGCCDLCDLTGDGHSPRSHEVACDQLRPTAAAWSAGSCAGCIVFEAAGQ